MSAQKRKVEGSDRCKPCDGYGSIWVRWSPNQPVQCGYCHGTGRDGGKA